MSSDQTLERNTSPNLAYRHQTGKGPGVFFLPGFNSDMVGNKATRLADHCAARNRAYTRFDYRGHGQSAGRFEEATVGDWIDDAVAIFDQCTQQPQILVGSSMGGWIMLHLALRRPARVAGLIGLAPAPDFSERMWARIPESGRKELAETGIYRAPSQYADTPYLITQKLLEEAPKHSLLSEDIAIQAPVRLLHGQQDPDVPWQGSLDLAKRLRSDNVEITLLKDGDHRLSRDADLALLTQTLDRLINAVADPARP